MSVILNKKAQMKIQQMVFMLLALTLFFVLIGLFFISFKLSDLEQSSLELERDRASELVGRISSNPEFVFENKENAIDADKLMVLSSKAEYRDFFGVDGIIVEKIYPVENKVTCTKSNYPNCNKIKLYTNAESASISSFVSWCSKSSLEENSYDKCEIALLMIEQ